MLSLHGIPPIEKIKLSTYFSPDLNQVVRIYYALLEIGKVLYDAFVHCAQTSKPCRILFHSEMGIIMN